MNVADTALLVFEAPSGSDPAPDVSVVVATRNRGLLLPRLFGALASQSLPIGRYEVVVVDDGSTDESAQVLVALAEAAPFPVRVFRLERCRGPAAARNVGWHAARSRLVAFTDDDCAPAASWLAAGLDAVESGAEMVVGRTIPDPEMAIGAFSRTIHIEGTEWFATCNVFYKRIDLELVGGFDERFPTPGGEDSDLAWRLKKLERVPTFVPEALVLHDVRADSWFGAVREAWRWIGIPLFFKIHPSARRHLSFGMFWKRTHPYALLAVAGIALAGWSVYGFALVVPWVWFRTAVERPLGRRRRVPLVLPGVLIVDCVETLAMVRGSIRFRTLVL